MSMGHVALLPTRITYRPVLELEHYTAESARHVSLGVDQEGTGAHPAPGSPLRRPGIPSSWCLAAWYHRLTAGNSGSSPSASFALRSPFSPPSNIRVASFRFTTTRQPDYIPFSLLTHIPLPLPHPPPAC